MVGKVIFNCGKDTEKELIKELEVSYLKIPIPERI